MDKLTLELFTSKNTYRKYLAKNDPETFQKQEIQQEKLQEYKSEIMQRIEEILDHPFPTGELGELSERFFSCLLQEIESSSKRREIEDGDRSNSLFYEDGSEGIEDLEDELFPTEKMEDSQEKKSFWSKDRVIKRETYSEAITHYPTNSEIRKRYVGKKMIN